MAGPPLPIAVGAVSATIVDVDGTPVAGTLALVCGLDLCIFGQSGQDGQVSLDLAGETVDHPAFKYGDGLTYARFATPITQAQTTFPAATTVRLPAAGPTLTAGAQATSADLTLSLSPGTQITIDLLTYDTPESQQFRAASLPLAAAPPAVDPSLNLSVLIAASPVDTLFCPPAAASYPNTPAWPPGTAVEFFLHGVSIDEQYAPYGGWAKVADGHVTPDGAAIATDPESGLPALGVLGIRQTPL